MVVLLIGLSQMCMLLLRNKKIRPRIENVWDILRATAPKTCFRINAIMMGGKKLSEAFFIISFHDFSENRQLFLLIVGMPCH